MSYGFSDIPDKGNNLEFTIAALERGACRIAALDHLDHALHAWGWGVGETKPRSDLGRWIPERLHKNQIFRSAGGAMAAKARRSIRPIVAGDVFHGERTFFRERGQGQAGFVSRIIAGAWILFLKKVIQLRL